MFAIDIEAPITDKARTEVEDLEYTPKKSEDSDRTESRFFLPPSARMFDPLPQEHMLVPRLSLIVAIVLLDPTL